MINQNFQVFLNFRGSYSIKDFSFWSLWPSKPIVFFKNHLKIMGAVKAAVFLNLIFQVFLTLTQIYKKPLYVNMFVFAFWSRYLGSFQDLSQLFLINPGKFNTFFYRSLNPFGDPIPRSHANLQTFFLLTLSLGLFVLSSNKKVLFSPYRPLTLNLNR